MGAPAISGASEEEGSPYIGWLASLVLIAVVFGVGAVLWFHFHGW